MGTRTAGQEESSYPGCAHRGSSPACCRHATARDTGRSRDPSTRPAAEPGPGASAPIAVAPIAARQATRTVLVKVSFERGEVVHDARGRQAVEEAPPVRTLHETAVEHGQDAAVRGGADEPSQ